MTENFPLPGGGGPFSRFLGFIKRFLTGFGQWIWSLVPKSITQHFNVGEAGLWGMITYVFGIIRYWYFLMTIPAIIVVYKLFKVLEEKGIIAKFQAIVQGALNMVMYVANDCFPLILHVRELASCVANSPLTL